MRLRITALAAAAAAALIAAQPARAAIVQVEFMGVADLNDQTGVTGPPGASYSALPFDLTYTIDTSTPGATHSTAPLPGIATVLNEITGQDGANPVQADISFGNGGGFSAGFDYGPPDGGASGTAARAILDPAAGFGTDGYLDYEAQTTIVNSVLNLNWDIMVAAASPTNFGQADLSLTHPFTYTFGPNDIAVGQALYEIDAFTVQALPAYAYASLTPTSMIVTVSGVPEPASWAMMLAGVAGLGAALRRRSLVSRPTQP